MIYPETPNYNNSSWYKIMEERARTWQKFADQHSFLTKGSFSSGYVKFTIGTFEKDIKPIMNTNCGGVFCHHGKPSTWTNYEFVKRSIDNGTFRERVIVKKDMPKRKPLSIVDYNLINDWLKNGAIEK